MRHDEPAVGAWLAKARMDLRAASVDLAAGPPLLADAAFHCQQAAEKAVKGLLVSRGSRFPKIHDIRVLGDLALRTDATWKSWSTAPPRLTKYAWLFRYPGDLWEPPEDEVRDALATATELVETVEARAGR